MPLENPASPLESAENGVFRSGVDANFALTQQFLLCLLWDVETSPHQPLIVARILGVPTTAAFTA